MGCTLRQLELGRFRWEDIMSTLWKSPQGDDSSKRVMGFILCPLGVLVMIIAGAVVNPLLVEVGTRFLYVGGVLLFGGVFEHLVKG